MPITCENIDKVISAVDFSINFRMFENALLLCQEIFPKFCDENILLRYARIYLYNGSPKLGVLLCKRYSHLLLKSTELAMTFGMLLFETGNYGESETVFRNIISTFPEDIIFKEAAYYYLGLCLVRTHSYASARPLFDHVFQHNPYIISAYRYNLKDCDLNCLTSQEPTKKPTITETLLTYSRTDPSTIKIIPDEDKKGFTYQIFQANFYFHTSQFEKALNIYRRMWDEFKYAPWFCPYYSTSLWHLHYKTEISALAKELSNMCPELAETWVVAGNLYSLENNPDKSIEMFERAASLDVSYAYPLTLAGHENLINKEDNEKAVNTFRSAISRDPSEYSSWYGIGLVLFKDNKFGPSRYYLNKAFKLNSSSSFLALALAVAESKCGNTDVALNLLEKALNMNPNNLVALFQKGVILFDQKKYDESKKCFLSLKSHIKNEPIALAKLGEIESINGNHEKALAYFTDAIIYGYTELGVPTETVLEYVENKVSNYLKECKNVC